jgi:hypothetical protein
MSWGPLFCRPRGVLVGAHDRGIDEEALIVPLTSESFEQPREGA